MFGFSVSISGDVALMGACYDDDNSGSSASAYVYTLVSENQRQVANAGSDIESVASSVCTATVTLNGSTSLDSDSTPVTNDDIEFFDCYEGSTHLGCEETSDYAVFPSDAYRNIIDD